MNVFQKDGKMAGDKKKDEKEDKDEKKVFLTCIFLL